MSGIELQALDTGELITITNEKTTIGRGPFLKITDKRVSRNHATLEVNGEGKLVVTPIHTNPCFLRASKAGDKVTLTKDEEHVLNDGDVLALLPDSLNFKVIYKDTKCPVKTEIKTEIKQEKQSVDSTSINGEGNDTPAGPTKTVKTGGVEMALPINKTRVLPTWMKGAAKRVSLKPTDGTSKKAPPKKQTAKNVQQPRGRTSKRDTASEDDRPPAKPTPRRGARARAKVGLDEDDYGDESEEDWEETTKTRRGKRKRYDDDESEDEEQLERKPSRQRRASAQKLKTYLDDLDFSDSEFAEESNSEEEQTRRKDDDSDFVMDEPESGSDWEVSHSQSSRKGKRKTRGRATPPSTKPKGPRRRRQSRRKDSDFSDDNDEAYIPRPSKSRASRGKPKANISEDESEEEKPVRGRRKQAAKYEEESDEQEEEEEVVTPPKKKTKKTTRDDDESNEDEVASPKKTKTLKKRKSCWFGKKCYRKNPKHFEEFCHPGDNSYDEEDKNEKAAPQRPKREKDKRSVLHNASDDDGQANTYDYNDSFLASDESGSSNSVADYDEVEEDSDWAPEDESVGSLVKEAKSFMKNKKLQKPARRK